MTVISRFSNRKSIPSVTTRKSSPTTTNFAKGIYTYKPNDLMGYDEVDLAQNARFDRIGEYATRHGLKGLHEPIGAQSTAPNYLEMEYELVDARTDSPYYTQIRVSGISNQLLYSVTAKLQPKDDTYGVIGCAIWDDVNRKIVDVSWGDPEAFSPDAPTDYEFVFNNPITITAQTVNDYMITFINQGTSKKEWYLGRTTDYESYPYCVIEKSCDPGEIGNIFEANIDGIRSVLFTFKTSSGCSLYAMEEDGTVNLIRNLANGVENVRFNQNMNDVRYADGKEAPHKLTYNKLTKIWTDSAITTTDLKSGETLQIKVSNILDDTQDNLMYFDSETDTQAIWCYPYGVEWIKEAKYVTTATLPQYDPYASSQQTATIALNTLTPTTTSVDVGDYITNCGFLRECSVLGV